MAPDDDLTSALEEKRAALIEAASEPVPDLDVMTRRAGLAAGTGTALLGALAAALKHHQRHDRGPGLAPVCTCTGRPLFPCDEYRDITKALNGGSDG